MYLKKTPMGFDIIMNGEIMRLKPAHAESLVAMLMSEMPGLPDRFKLIWALRTEPRARIVEKYRVVDGGVVPYYLVEVFIPNCPEHTLFTGPEHYLALKAIQNGWDMYGSDIEITEYTRDLVSRRLADKELERSKVGDKIMEMFGLTLKQVTKYVSKHGRLPPELASYQEEVHSMNAIGQESEANV